MPCSARLSRALISLALIGDTLAAQPDGHAVFRGLVTTDFGNRVLAGAEITFKQAARSVRTAADGRFIFYSLPAGSYIVTVRHPGYRPIDGTVRLVDTDTIDWHFDMVTPGTELSPVEVRVNPDSARPMLREFERRRLTTSGKFLTDTDIQRLGSTNLANVIRTRVSGFDLVQHPSGSGTALASRRTGRPTAGVNACYTAIWINGQLFYEMSKAEQPPRLEDLHVDEVAGIELYRVSEVPPELAFRGGNCGVVVLWMLVPRRKYPPPD